MYLEEDILKFIVLTDTGTREPLYVMFRILNKHSWHEIQSFIDLLISMIDEEVLHCDYWSREDQRHYPLKEGFAEKIQSYVKGAMQRNEPLTNEPEGMPLFEFIITDKGQQWLDNRVTKVELKGLTYIESLEAYRAEKNKYPNFIYELYPTYLKMIEEPFEVYGSWWYSVNKQDDEFYFGYFTYEGCLFVYDKQTTKWRRSWPA